MGIWYNPFDDWLESTSPTNHPADYEILGLIRECKISWIRPIMCTPHLYTFILQCRRSYTWEIKWAFKVSLKVESYDDYYYLFDYCISLIELYSLCTVYRVLFQSAIFHGLGLIPQFEFWNGYIDFNYLNFNQKMQCSF